jgi:hypothetical protein
MIIRRNFYFDRSRTSRWQSADNRTLPPEKSADNRTLPPEKSVGHTILQTGYINAAPDDMVVHWTQDIYGTYFRSRSAIIFCTVLASDVCLPWIL